MIEGSTIQWEYIIIKVVPTCLLSESIQNITNVVWELQLVYNSYTCIIIYNLCIQHFGLY